ncbi:hypothetical protein BDF21DRAFT_424763 [Thamnidium elegans]|nr:hypothetical protein BDF21DRAFT_424763 [Thamnidium elegans]
MSLRDKIIVMLRSIMLFKLFSRVKSFFVSTKKFRNSISPLELIIFFRKKKDVGALKKNPGCTQDELNCRVNHGPLESFYSRIELFGGAEGLSVISLLAICFKASSLLDMCEIMLSNIGSVGKGGLFTTGSVGVSLKSVGIGAKTSVVSAGLSGTCCRVFTVLILGC